MINFNHIWNAFWGWNKKHAPEIFTGLGIAGMGVTVYTVYKCSPEIHDILEEKKDESTWEKTKAVASVCWPSALAFGTSAGMILWSNRISNKRNFAWATSAALAQKELIDFQNATLEKVGEDTLKEIKEKVTEKHLENVDTSQVDITNSDKFDDPRYGDFCDLFYEPITGHLFWFNKSKLQEVENNMNALLLMNDTLSLARVYSEFGIEETAVTRELEFSIYDGKKGFVKFVTTPGKTHNGELCWELSFEVMPTGTFPSKYW